MANFNNIKHEIDQNVNTNGQQAITGAILNETLKDMLDEVDDKKQDTLVAGQNITIQGNVISATGGGSGSYVEGNGIEISGNIISVAPDEIAGSGLRSDGEGHLELDPNDLPPTYAEGFGIDITTGPDVIAVDTSVIQEKLTAGSNITLSGTTISATDTTYSAGSGILIDQNNEISADTSVLQPKLTAGSGISISAQNVISATGGGGGGTTYGDGDAISIDSNDNINVLYGNGLQLDGNGALEVDTAQVASDLAGNGLQVDANGALEVDPFGMPFLPLAGGQLQDDPNNTNSTDLNITSPSSYAHIDAYTEDDPNNPGGTAYVEVYDMNGTAQYGSDGITVNGDKLTFPAGPATLATQSDLSDYLPLTGGTLNNTGQINTNLSVQSPNSDYHVNTYVPNSGSVEIEIGMSSGQPVQNPSDGDTKNLRVYKDKVDLYTYDSNTSNWRTDSLYFPKKKTGTIALDSDLAGKQDTLVSGTNIKTINGNSLLGNGDITISGGQSYTAGNGIDITSGTISVDIGSGLGFDQNGALYATGGGGSGLWVSGTGTNSLMAPLTDSTSGTSSAWGSISAGNATTASGNMSFAGGESSTASGSSSFSYGYNNTASGTGAAALGSSNQASSNSFAAGSGNIAGSNTTTAIALGASNTSGGFASASIGGNLNTHNDYEVALGYRNKSYAGNPQQPGDDNVETIFTLGNGSGNSLENAIEVKKNNDVYIYGIGGFDGTNSASAQTLQNSLGGGTTYSAGSGLNLNGTTFSVDTTTIQSKLSAGSNISISGNTISATDTTYTAGSGISIDAQNVISATGGGGTSFTAGDALELDQNDNLNVLYGSGLTLSANNELEVDPTSITGFLPETGGTLQETDPNSTLTTLSIQSPIGNGAIDFTSDDDYDGNGNSKSVIGIDDSNGSISIGTDGILDNNTGYTLSFPTLTQNDTIATLSDISGSGSYVAGNGIDITSGTISVDETYLDSVYLPILGGSLENTSNHTDLRVDAPNSESDNFVDILSPGTGVPSVELGTDTNTQGEVESLKFKGDADIDIKYVGDNTTYTLSFPTLTQNETIATLSDIQGGGTSYTAGTGISISAQNVISNSAPDPGLWLAGTGTDSIRSSNSSSSSTGNNTLTFGQNAYVSTNGCIALGRNTSCGGNALNGVAIGNGASVQSSNEIGLGPYNQSYGSTLADSIKTRFTIGRGTNAGTASNSFEIKQNDDVYVYGIGGFTGTNGGSTGINSLQTVINGKQDALTAGTGISISGNVISATGGGGGSSLWTSGTGTDSLIAPATITAGLSVDPAQGTGAISCGYDTNADGDYAFAQGGQSSASGDYSFAANNGTSSGDYSASFGSSGAYGNDSFAAGTGSIAGAQSSVALAGGITTYDDSDPYNIINAEGSVAIGNGAAANAYQAIAIGSSANTSDIAIDGIAIGVNAYANAQEAVAIGSGSIAEGIGTVALSSGTASGERSTAMSTGSAVGSYSVAGGLGAIASICSSVALGFNTMTYDQGNPDDDGDPQAGETALGRYNYTEQDIIFSVGCGYELYHDPNDPDFQPNPDDPDNPDGWTEIVRKNAITITTDGSIYINDLGGYAGTVIGGAESLQTVISNLNPL